MADAVDACAEAELPPGARKTVQVGPDEVAIFNVAGQLYAIHNLCPHRGGPLGEGDLDGFVLHCPLHAWPFDLRTGQCTLFSEARVRVFEVRVENGRVLVAAAASSSPLGRGTG